MKILVTGSNGYLGSSFIKIYKNKYLFERFSFLKQQLEGIGFSGIDVVLHCAALVHQKQEFVYEKYHEVNVQYPVNLAKLSKEYGVKQFVFISTIAVYGEEKENLKEDTICNPLTPYGKSKLEAEKELLKLNDDNFVVSVIRPPMIYGNSAPGNIDSLIKLIEKVYVIPLGNIENKRSFISIQNLCYMIENVIEQKKSGTFIASDDEPLSTTRLIKLIAKSMGKKVYLVKIPFFETLLRLIKPSLHKRLYGSLEIDNSETKKKIGIKNPYTVEDGIRLMIKGEDI